MCSPGRIILVLLFTLLGGCMQHDETDYCKNHYRFHGEHLDGLARLTLGLDESGALSGMLHIPDKQMQNRDLTARQLLTPENAFTLQSTSACRKTRAEAIPTKDGLRVDYEAICGPDNKIGQVDVVLFDTLPNLDEALVEVVTPATAKKFAISRRCENAIFRLEE